MEPRKARSPFRLLAAAAATLLLAAAGSSQAANIYRYVDENGRTVFNTSIPPEHARNGYTILDERGRVLREVPRAPSEEELAELESRRELERQAELERQKQEEYDRLLVRLYRSPDEIARKRDERLEQLGAQRTALGASLSKAGEDVARLQAQVDQAGSAGHPAPEAVLQTLAGARNNQATLETQIERLDAEMAEVSATAESDMVRLRELLSR